MSALNQLISSLVTAGGGGGATYGTVSFVQAGVEQTFTGSVKTITFPGSITAGNHILVGVGMYESGGGADGTPSVTSTHGTAVEVLQSTVRTELSGFSRVSWWRITSAAGGTAGVDVNGVSPYGICAAFEVSSSNGNIAVLGSAGDATGSSATPSVSVTPAESGVSVIAVAGLVVVSANNALGIDLPSSYTNIGIEQDSGSELGVSLDYRAFTTSGSAESPSWGTLTGSEPWTAGIALICAPD